MMRELSLSTTEGSHCSRSGVILAHRTINVIAVYAVGASLRGRPFQSVRCLHYRGAPTEGRTYKVCANPSRVG